MKNIFSIDNNPKTGEIFSEIIKHKNVIIEKIISSNKPGDKIYCQDQDEWVVILNGSAKLKIKDETHVLHRGEHLFIKSKTPHQVLETEKGTVWLAIHIY